MSDSHGPSTAATEARSDRQWKVKLRSLARDFLLIVTGVLTALALENWNAGYKEQRLETEYLLALAADTRSHMSSYESRAERLGEHSAWTARIWGWANGASPQQPVNEVLLWLRLGGQLNLTTLFQDGAYQDLVNSGKLGLIQDRTVRDALIDYHNYHIRWNSLSEANGQRAADRYTEAVANLIPADVAWRASNAEDLSTVNITPILAEFRNRPAVRHALVGLAESHRFRSNAATQARERAASLLSILEAELRTR
jgi:hypothetical protein